MYELTDLQTENAAGGASVFGMAWTFFNAGLEIAKDFQLGMSAVGGTLNNYYGQDMTLEIVAAGNMGA